MAGTGPAMTDLAAVIASVKSLTCSTVLSRSLQQASRPHRALLPQPEAALEGVAVGAAADFSRQFVDLVGVAAAEHDVIGLQRGEQALEHVIDLALPFFPAEALERGGADALLEGLAMAVRQMRQLHRLQHAVGDHRRTEAGAESEEQHLAALIAADRLHQRVVDDPGRPAERLLEIEAAPAGTEIVRLRNRPVVGDRPGIADRDELVGPVARQRLDLAHHLSRGEIRPGLERAPCAILRCHHLDARAADVDRQDHRPRRTLFRLLRHRYQPRAAGTHAVIICRGEETNNSTVLFAIRLSFVRMERIGVEKIGAGEFLTMRVRNS
jgi:hypothetical protein